MPQLAPGPRADRRACDEASKKSKKTNLVESSGGSEAPQLINEAMHRSTAENTIAQIVDDQGEMMLGAWT